MIIKHLVLTSDGFGLYPKVAQQFWYYKGPFTKDVPLFLRTPPPPHMGDVLCEWPLTHCAESSTVNIYLMYEDKVVQMHPEDNQENFCNITVHLQENLKKETFPISAKSLIFGK